ncbi:unnamed protein product [Closterium sp. Naga37s-1]|nr:unnamed protein product [Closterium sp. Naga37s-1]
MRQVQHKCAASVVQSRASQLGRVPVDHGLPNHMLLCCAYPAAHPPPPPPSPTPTPAAPSTPPATRALTFGLSLATDPPPLPACMPLLLSPALRFRLHAHRAAAYVGAGEGVQAGVQGVAAGARREGKLRQLLRGGRGVFSFYSLRCNWRSLLRWVDWGVCAWGSERGVWGRAVWGFGGVRGAMVDVAWCMQDKGHMTLGEELPACTSHPHALHMRGPLAAPLLLSIHHSLLRPAYHPPANACLCCCLQWICVGGNGWDCAWGWVGMRAGECVDEA